MYRKGRLIVQYASTDLERIILYESPNKSGLHRFPTEFYCYARIIPKNNKPHIIITSLMTSGGLEELDQLKGVKTEIKKTPFASINFPLILP